MSITAIILSAVGGAAIGAYLVKSLIDLEKDKKKAYKQYCEDKEQYMLKHKETNYVIEDYKTWLKLDKENKLKYKQDRTKETKHNQWTEKD